MTANVLVLPARARRPRDPALPDRRVATEDRRRGIDPADDLRPWIRIARDAALVALGVFMLVHETLAAAGPRPVVVGAALVSLGLPQAFRINQDPGDH